MLRYSSPFQLLWAFLSLASAFLMWVLTMGMATWNGTNFAVWLYLITSTTGTIGLLAGFCVDFSRKKLFNWITLVSAIAITILSVIYTAGFIFESDPSVSWRQAIYFGGVPFSLIEIYGGAFLCCSAQATLSLLRIKDQHLV